MMANPASQIALMAQMTELEKSELQPEGGEELE